MDNLARGKGERGSVGAAMGLGSTQEMLGCGIELFRDEPRDSVQGISELQTPHGGDTANRAGQLAKKLR